MSTNPDDAYDASISDSTNRRRRIRRAVKVIELEAALEAERAITRRLREGLEAVLSCETKHDERGHAYLRVPARSLNDLGAELRALLRDTTQEEK